MCSNFEIVFTAPTMVKSFYTFKDKLLKILVSGLTCGGNNATYYSKIKRHFKVRICEHLVISHLMKKT